MRKERWLEFHDRFTSGIPGLFPAVLGLPVRFTESIDAKSREMGVFKYCRGNLRGWKLPEAETQRLQALEESEVVLHQCPVKLFIAAPTGNI